MIRCIHAIGSLVLALSTVSIMFAQQPATCTDESCHAIDPSVTVSDRHLRLLKASLNEVAPSLSAQIENQSICEHCDPQQILDQFALIEVSINAESRVKVDAGQVKQELIANCWNTFLVKIKNLAGVTAPLTVSSDQQIDDTSNGNPTANRTRWLDIEMASNKHLDAVLSGETVEYRILRIRTDQTGKRAAVLAFDVGQGTADIGFRNDTMLTFDCLPPSSVLGHLEHASPVGRLIGRTVNETNGARPQSTSLGKATGDGTRHKPSR